MANTFDAQLGMVRSLRRLEVSMSIIELERDASELRLGHGA